LQLEFFKYECDKALESVREAQRKTSEDMLSELGKIKNPPELVAETSKTYLQIVGLLSLGGRWVDC